MIHPTFSQMISHAVSIEVIVGFGQTLTKANKIMHDDLEERTSYRWLPIYRTYLLSVSKVRIEHAGSSSELIYHSAFGTEHNNESKSCWNVKYDNLHSASESDSLAGDGRRSCSMSNDSSVMECVGRLVSKPDFNAMWVFEMK
jgi:hypothetical protein